MFVTAPGYRASRDTLHFNRKQKRVEQQRVLADLSLRQLSQLRHAIRFEGERIPGRTARESLDMVNHVINWCLEVDRHRQREADRRALCNLGIAFGAAAVVTGCVFALTFIANGLGTMFGG